MVRQSSHATINLLCIRLLGVCNASRVCVFLSRGGGEVRGRVTRSREREDEDVFVRDAWQ